MRFAIPLLAAALACSLASAPAHARARVFVASYGNDSNPCTFGSPCKTFQQAVTIVDAGGEVTAIDSAGFGPITITKAVTITSPAGVEAGIVPNPGGDAIDINAGPNDTVVLSGLTLNGAGSQGQGIRLNSGLRLEIINCVIRNFTFDGILFIPTAFASLLISNTIVSDSGDGVTLSSFRGGAIIAALDHISINNNQYGVNVGDVRSLQPIEALIKDSSIDNNINAGVIVTGVCASNAIATVALRSVSLNQTPIPIQVADCSNVYMSHVVQALAPPLTYNPGVIFGSHNQNHVYSDGTNLTSAPPGSFEVWAMQ
jgi:hypothetical protein